MAQCGGRFLLDAEVSKVKTGGEEVNAMLKLVHEASAWSVRKLGTKVNEVVAAERPRTIARGQNGSAIGCEV
jgi:hypothetical protein